MEQLPIKKKKQQGMTLIEMMIAFCIFAIVVLGAAAVLVQSKQMAEEARFRLLAINTAKTTLETIKNTALANVGTINTNALVAAGLPNGTVTITTNPSPVGAATIATVTVRVQWTGPKNRTQQLDVSTMRSVY